MLLLRGKAINFFLGKRKDMKISGFQDISDFIPSSGKKQSQLTKQNIKSGFCGK